MSNEEIGPEVEVTGDGNVVGDDSIAQVFKAPPGSQIGEVSQTIIKYAGREPPTRIPWPELKRLCERVSEPRLAFVAQRFDTDLYVHREDVQGHVDRFLGAEDKNYFALVGKSGVGKSAFLWGAANRLKEHPGVAYLFCDASIHLQGQQSIIDALLQDLAKAFGRPPGEILRAANPREERPGQRLVFIVDAINEFQSMNAMQQMLRDFHSCATLYPWLQIIVSCRPHFWTYIEGQRGALGIANRYFYRAASSEELCIAFKQPNDEAVSALYGKYREKYRFEPADMADLDDPRLRKRLREPLMLLLVSEVCAEQSISEQRDLVLVDVEAIPAYVKKLRQRGELCKQDERFLKETLPQLFVRGSVCSNYVPREWIHENCDRADVQQVLSRLIRSGILKEDGAQRLSFTFERFFGYYLGLYLRDIASKGISLTCSSFD
jgi:hypothetical protein